jgi:hypothetical protein
MRTLLNPKDKQEIIQRLGAVRADSQRRWGKMSAHQMVCHLCDSFRCYMGEKPVSRAPGWFPRRTFKWLALWVPVPWPRGFRTRPELDQQTGGTRPAEFEGDMRELLSLLDRFTGRPRNYEWPAHPFFGQMTEKDWMRMAYLHADHHLRQFGA